MLEMLARMRANRGALEQLGLSGAAVILHPWYALVLALGWVATRAYYRKRWNLTYP